MTDRKGLGIIGYLLGGLTAAVMLVGGFVVNLSLADDTPRRRARDLSDPLRRRVLDKRASHWRGSFFL